MPDVTAEILDALKKMAQNPANAPALENITAQIRRARPELPREEAEAQARALFMLNAL